MPAMCQCIACTISTIAIAELRRRGWERLSTWPKVKEGVNWLSGISLSLCTLDPLVQNREGIVV